MSWKTLCASSQPLDNRQPSEDHSGHCADFADIAGDLIAPMIGQKGGFADIANIALDIKKDTLSLREETPVKYHSEETSSAPSPGVPLQSPHNSSSSAEYAKSAKPLQPGWLVVYQDRTGRLRGGTDERPAGTVLDCDERCVSLTSGTRLPSGQIVGVAVTDGVGAVRSAWLVRRHGLDGTQEGLT